MQAQAAVNEYGLFFDFTQQNIDPSRYGIKNPYQGDLFMTMLGQCKTVSDVLDFLKTHSFANSSQALVADALGNSVIINAGAQVEKQGTYQINTNFNVYQWAVTQVQQRLPVYVYRFTRKVPATGAYANYGAFHTAEVAYAYDNLRFIDKQLRPLRPADDKLAHTIATYWVNFIKTGNPNGKELPHWPAFATPNDSIVQLDSLIRARPLPDRAALSSLVNTLRTP